MALVRLPIRKPFYSTDSVAKSLRVDSARDCFYESDGEGGHCLRRRPGYSLFSTIGETAVYDGGILKTGQGLFWSDRFAAAFAVANGYVYRIESDGTATQLAGDILNTLTRVIFAEGQDLSLDPFIYLAHGGTLRYTDGTTVDTPSDASVPTACTYVASLNNRIFANNGGQDFYITDTDPGTGLLDPFYWSATTNPWRTALKADLLKAIWAAWNEVSLWNTQSVEYWQEDQVNPISPLVGATTEAGIEAEYSIVQADNTLFALMVLGGKRAVVRMENRQPKVISNDIDSVLQGYTTVSDAYGSLVFAGGLNAYILSFPSENATWAYDLREGIWTEWGEWNASLSRYDAFPIIGSCYAKPWNKHLFQTPNGDIYTLNRGAYQDAGDTLRTLIRTGWIDHNTTVRKRSNYLFLKMKAYAGSTVAFLVRWRDDGRPEWSPFQSISLGATAEQTQYCKLSRMGMYRSRQYEIVMTANSDLALVELSEDIDMMGH